MKVAVRRGSWAHTWNVARTGRGRLFAVCLFAVSAGASTNEGPARPGDEPDVVSSHQEIIVGSPIPDPSAIGVVRFEWTKDATHCSYGSGVLLTNDIVLTAAHVFTDGLADSCQPNTLKITLPDAVGGVQLRQW